MKNKTLSIVKSVKKFAVKRWKILSVLALILLLVFLVRSRNSAQTYQIAEVRKGELTESLSTSGRVKADQNAALTFQTAGEMAWIGVNEGDTVRQGQLLAKLDATTLNSNYMIALSNLRAAEATLDRVLDQVQGHDVGESYADKETRTLAETAKDRAYDSMVSAKKSLSGAFIYSPFPGIVTEVSDNAVVKSNVMPTTPIVTVINPGTVYFEAEVNEIDVTQLHAGQRVIVSLDAYSDRDFEGEIENIAFNSTITSTGGTAYPVKISIPLENVHLRMGMKGDAEFVLGETQNVLLIPQSAIIEEEDKTYVWRLDNDERINRVEIMTGKSSIDEIEVTSGLSEGDRIVDFPSPQLKEGTQVATS